MPVGLGVERGSEISRNVARNKGRKWAKGRKRQTTKGG